MNLIFPIMDLIELQSNGSCAVMEMKGIVSMNGITANLDGSKSVAKYLKNRVETPLTNSSTLFF